MIVPLREALLPNDYQRVNHCLRCATQPPGAQLPRPGTLSVIPSPYFAFAPVASCVPVRGLSLCIPVQAVSLGTLPGHPLCIPRTPPLSPAPLPSPAAQDRDPCDSALCRRLARYAAVEASATTPRRWW